MLPGDRAEPPIRTLIVEDEPAGSAVHRDYVERLAGFEVCAVASSGREATRLLARGQVDLVLLDLHLPDVSGLELLRRIRAAGSTVDVIVVTSARDTASVRAALAQGAVQYVLKPFVFATLREKLLSYQSFRRHVAGSSAIEQAGLDRALDLLRSAGPGPLPKGMNAQTLELVAHSLGTAGEASASEVAQQLGISRITARRYLSHLVDSGLARNGHRYGQVGRPELRFRLTSGG